MTPEQLGPTPEQMNIRPVEGEVNEVNLHKKVPPATDSFIIDFIEKLRSSRLEAAMQNVMETSGIDPKYNEGNEDALAEQRQKLETMPGIMIANHPGRFDTLIVLDILKKRITEKGDVKFLVAGGQFYEFLAGIFGKDLVLSAERSKDPIGESVKHITENGGLLMIYPTGGQDTEFKSGFKLICQRIPDNSMVYAVQIDEHDLAMVGKEPADDAKHNIHVHEVFTNANEWTAELADSLPAEQNHKMTEHYQSLFAEVNAQKTYTTESPEDRRKREEQMRIIGELFKNARDREAPLYLFASFADDILLYDGKIAESHGDVDAICLRTDVEKIKEILKEMGCDDIEEETGNPNYYSDGLPLKITAQLGEIEVDIPILDFEEERQEPYYSITNNEGKKYRIYFGKNFFSKKSIDTTAGQLSTVSPLGLIQARLFYPALEGIELRDKDRRAAEALRDKFFPGEDLTDKKFMPEIVEVKE